MIDAETKEKVRAITWEMAAPLYWLLGYALVAAILLVVLYKFVKIPKPLDGIIGAGTIFLVFYIWFKTTF